MVEGRWRALLDDVTADNLSGARGITAGVAGVLSAYGRQGRPSDVDALRADLSAISGEALRAHAAMASVLNLLNAAWQAVEQASDRSSMLAAIGRAAQAFEDRLAGVGERVARQAVELLWDGACVLTISASSTVETALLQGCRQGLALRVLCLESRPMLEGRLLAGRLAQEGVRVALGVDAAASQMLEEADVVLVGVDSLAADGAVGKIGTSGLALAADAAGVPLYALADRSKIWPHALGAPVLSDHSRDEVWTDAPEAVTVHNRYFDVTNWALIGGVALEDGLTSSDDVLAAGRARAVHGRLIALYEQLRAQAVPGGP